MEKGKRLLSLLLATAMVITGVNLGNLPVQAAEGGQPVTLQAERFEGSGGQKYADEGLTIATSLTGTENRNGDSNGAAFVMDDTSNESGSNLGSARVGAIQFDVSQFTSSEEVDEAILTIHVRNVNGNISGGGKWFKAAIFQTANDESWVAVNDSNPDNVSAEDKLGPKFPALNNDYSYDATMWSRERISSESVGDKTFDVTKALKAAVEAGKQHMVLRLQTVAGGFYVDGAREAGQDVPANVPTLAVATSKKSSVTVKYQDEENNELKEAKTIEMVKAGYAYTYEVPEEEKRIETESGLYVCDESASTLSIAEVKENAADNVVTLVYKKPELNAVAPLSPIYVIEGNTPILPKQVAANTNIEGYTLPVNVTWEDTSDMAWTAGEHNVTGTAEGLEGENAKVKATVHVFECDETVEGTVANDAKQATKLKRGYTGIIETEYDLVTKGTLGADSVVAYFDQGVTEADPFWMSSTSTRFTGGKFFVNGGNGKGGSAGNSGSKDYPAEADRTMAHDGTKVYRVRTQIDTTGVSVSEGAVTGNGAYRVWVTDPDGHTEEITNPEEPMTFRKVSTGIIDKVGAARAGFEITNHRISWQSGYSTAKIEYRMPDGTSELVAPTISKEFPGTVKAIDTSVFTPKSKDGMTYLFDSDKSGWDANGDGTVDSPATNEATMPASGSMSYIAVYKQAAFVAQAETVQVKTVTGKQPILPNTVGATYQNVDEPIATEVEWNLEGCDFTKETEDGKPLEITGTFITGAEAKATVEVKNHYLLASYKFDGENPAEDSAGSHADAELVNAVTTDIAGVDGKGNGVKLTGGKNGSSYVKLPDDLLQIDGADRGSKVTQDDITISMFINRESNADTFAMILHGTQVGKASPQGHLGLINKDKLLDMEYRIGGATVAHLTAKDEKDNNIITPTNQWTHIAIVTNGAENMAKLYLDGVLAGTVEGICKPSQLVAQNNYLGRSSWADDDYKATFDEFEVYNGLLTEQEIQEIANEKLCKTPVTDIHERLALTLQSGAAFDKSAVTENLNLPTTMETSDGKTIQGLKITWQSDNPAIRTDGTVIRPSKGRNDAIVNLTAKIQYGSYMLTKVFSDITVKESDTVSFVVFDEVFEQAKAKYESGAAENIYTQASLEALGAKITAAEAVKATEGTDAADADQVDEMVAQLEAAMNGLELKSFAELNKTLAAWYPLDDNKAKDASGHGVDGAPADSIVFNRENGAAFNGGTARKNIIQLPKESLDKLNVTDQMTFSFWTNIAEDRNLFGMGSLIGENDSDKKDNGGRSKHFYIKSTLNAFMTANGWAQDAHKGFGNIKVSRNEWHHIAVVINGQKMTLYIDKQKVNDTVDTDITMTAAWNHNEGANRYFYIGNCAYGHNGDADFKGSIRDFRIYNAALAQKQIEDAYGYLGNIDMEYAKADLIKEIGARAEDNGQFTLNVTNENTTNKVFNLPKTSYGEAKVAWKSTDNAILNADTGLAAIPDQKEAEKKVDLTATITIGDGEQQRTEEIVFKCKVYYRNNIPTTDLENALNALKGKNLNESNYTAASWAALQAAIAEAQAQIDNPDSEQAVADAKNKLAAEEGNLVNIAGLREKVKTLEEELKGLKDKENDYSQASWDGLQEKLAAAKKVLGTSDATAAAVSEVTNALPQTAASALKACGNKKPLENAIADAETLGTYKDAYTEASWAALEKALQTAKEELAKRLEDYASAAAALTKAAEALEIKADHKLEGAVKEGLEEKLAEAKAEKLSSGNYTQRTWSVYQEALEVFEAVLGRANATKDEAEAAAKALEDARAALEPIASQKPDEEKKQEFTTAYEEAVQASADLKPETYTQESWNRYQNALAAMEKLSKRLAEANNNVTKDEIDATITELNEAVAALVKNVDKDALDKAIAEFGKLKASAYTTKTWKPFKDALDAAKKVSVNADATQEEVDNALKTLNAKKKALKKIVKVTGLTLSAASKSIAIGKKVTVKPTVKPSNATDKTVSWKSSNTKWATVKNGVVSMKKAGAGKTVTITTIAKDGSKKKAAIKIKIMKNAVTKVSFKIKSKAVKNGKKITLKPDIKTNGKKANKKLSWKSSNTKWATVNAKGVVATKKAGKGKTVTITATSTDGTNKKASVKVKITK